MIRDLQQLRVLVASMNSSSQTILRPRGDPTDSSHPQIGAKRGHAGFWYPDPKCLSVLFKEAVEAISGKRNAAHPVGKLLARSAEPALDRADSTVADVGGFLVAQPISSNEDQHLAMVGCHSVESAAQFHG